MDDNKSSRRRKKGDKQQPQINHEAASKSMEGRRNKRRGRSRRFQRKMSKNESNSPPVDTSATTANSVTLELFPPRQADVESFLQDEQRVLVGNDQDSRAGVVPESPNSSQGQSHDEQHIVVDAELARSPQDLHADNANLEAENEHLRSRLQPSSLEIAEPMQENGKSNNKRKRLYVLSGLLLLIVTIAVSVGVPLANNRSSGNDSSGGNALRSRSPTGAPTSSLAPSTSPAPSHKPSAFPSSSPTSSPAPSANPSVAPSTSPSSSLFPSAFPQDLVALGQRLHGRALKDRFGVSVSISNDGTVMAVGASQSDGGPGYVSVFQLNKSTTSSWTPMGDTIVGLEDEERFGLSISLNGNGTMLAIGAPDNNDGTGRVAIYQYDENSWMQLGNTLQGQEADDLFGSSVSLDGEKNMLAVGAQVRGIRFGTVRIYQYQNDTWEQLGQTLVGPGTGSDFGNSVSLRSNIVAVGARSLDLGSRFNAGQVAVFQYNDNNATWVPIGNALNGPVSDGFFGTSVSLNDSGQVLAVGAPSLIFSSFGSVPLAFVSVFEFDKDAWIQRGQTLVTEQQGDSFGGSVSLSRDGNTVAVGIPTRNKTTGQAAGQVRIYKYNNNKWNQVGQELNGETEGDWFGSAVSLSGDTTVGIGAVMFPTRGTGYTKVFELI